MTRVIRLKKRLQELLSIKMTRNYASIKPIDLSRLKFQGLKLQTQIGLTIDLQFTVNRNSLVVLIT